MGMQPIGLSEFDSMTRSELITELTDLRARCEKDEPIAEAARNLVAQKGRHNTEIAYKRVEDVIAKDRT